MQIIRFNMNTCNNIVFVLPHVRMKRPSFSPNTTIISVPTNNLRLAKVRKKSKQTIKTRILINQRKINVFQMSPIIFPTFTY